MFPNVTLHPDWLRAQSKEWCNELAAQTGRYAFPWKYTFEGIAAEDVFKEELAKLIRGKVLDVGCGHGEFTNLWADRAEEVVGFDTTEGFLATANANKKTNVRFVLGNTKNGMPFGNGEFDVAYTKKGPTSWYPEAGRIVKEGGDVLSLHPGDGNGEGGELGVYFPGLFPPPAKGTPVGDLIQTRLAESGLNVMDNRVLRETVYIRSAEDVIELLCFGQKKHVAKQVRDEILDDVRVQFDRNCSDKGLKMTTFHYLIHAKSKNE